MKFEFRIAEPRDDEALRELVAAHPVPGSIQMTFEREPSYFLGSGTMGDSCTTIVAVESTSGELAGTACIARAERYIKGVPTVVGYIGQMRAAEKYRGYMLPLRGMLSLKETLLANQPALFFTVIPNENVTTKAIFTGNLRRSFPKLTEVAQLVMIGIDANRFRAAPPGIVKSGSRELLPRIVSFLNDQGNRREFYPVYKNSDFRRGVRTRGFLPSDFLLVEEGDRIIGVAGLWNQTGYKQSVVQGYRGFLRTIKPIYNAFAPMFSMSRLPNPGEPVRSAFFSFLAIQDDEPGILYALIGAACADARRQNLDYVILGLSEGDPLLTAARKYFHISYRSTMYAFSFSSRLPDAAVPTGLPCYPEAATL